MVYVLSKKTNERKKNQKNKAFYLICGLFILFISSMSIGFALYNKILPINGIVTLKAPGQLEITNISEVSIENIDSNIIDFNLKNFEFNIYPKDDFKLWVLNVNDKLLLKPNNLYVSIDDLKLSIPYSTFIKLPNTSLGFYNTVDNKIYKPNDLVRIDTSTHFISIKEF